jgi:hypothetical protein
MLKPIIVVFSALLISQAAFAQTNRAGRNGNANGNQGGVFTLPKNVDRMVALEHNNTVIAQTREDDGSKSYAALQLRHISPRALAYIFGATTIPTEALVMPPSMNNGFNGGGQNSGFPGNNGANNSGFNNGNNGFNGGGNGFMFPQSNTNPGNGFGNNFGNSFNNGLGNQPQWNNGNANRGNFPQNAPLQGNGAGLNFGTPAGNTFLPSQTTN